MRKKLPKLGLLYFDYVLRFFDRSNFKGWPEKIEIATYHWKNDKKRFIKEVKAKKIDILIGNVPATAYETFRDIARELPHVRFIPSLDAQFSNKSKENVTRFCEKYNIPVPATKIYYDLVKADKFLKKCSYPKIIKRSYGPSNYGGYYVHKVDSYKEAKHLLETKKYFPAYIQDFISMEADIRVMLIGHKPVCAFWRRPSDGGWLTNTSQGGSMDYNHVPKGVLELATRVSKAANAEYWACDIAVGKDGKFRILECATAFAAFPYIRDWIGAYLMWKFGNGQFKKPHLPLYNWEELGRISSNFLRTMRHISFSKYTPSYDGEYYLKKEDFLMTDTKEQNFEEWPSEAWNFMAMHANAKRFEAPSSDEVIQESKEVSCEVVKQPKIKKAFIKSFLLEESKFDEKSITLMFKTFKRKELLAMLNQEKEPAGIFLELKKKKREKLFLKWTKHLKE